MFPDLFRHLDENRERLGIASFGLSATTLEEVFLNLAKEEEEDEEKNGEEGNVTKPEQTEEGQTRENVEGNSGNTADDLEKGKDEGEGEEGKGTEKGSSPEKAFNLELPEYECKRNLCSQFTGIMSHVTLQGIRNPFGICYIVIWPVIMALILGFIHLAIEKPTSTPIELVPSLVDGEGTFIYDSPEAKDILGRRLAASSATTDKSIYEACRENSYDAVFNREWTDPTYDGGISLEDPSSTKEAQLFFNPKTEYSARVLLQQYYNANNNGTAAKCYYQAWPRDISQNYIGGGGLQFIIVSAFAIFGAFYCEDIVRVRISRSKICCC